MDMLRKTSLRTGLAIASLLAALLGATGQARAQAPSEDVDPDVEAARAHFERGRAAYQARDYATALMEFERARLIKPLAAFDYNIARCHDRLEHWREAIEAYERFVKTTNEPTEREEALQRISVLRKRLQEMGGPAPAQQQQAAPSPTTPAPSPPPAASAPEHARTQEAPAPAAAAPATASTEAGPRRRSVAAPAVLAGVAVAALAVGAGLLASGYLDYGKLRDRCAGACSPDEATTQGQPLQTRVTAGAAVLAVGGAVAIVDVALWVVARRQPAPSPAVARAQKVASGLLTGWSF
jgi:tetratricopeptide (TPR) repeat protein